MTIEQKAKRLVELRDSISQQEEAFKKSMEPLKQEKEKLQEEIITSLKRTKQLSAKFEFATISRKFSRRPKVVDEGQVIHYLTLQGLDAEYVTPRLTDSFDGFAKQAMKEGVEVPGLEIRETEYISVLQAKV